MPRERCGDLSIIPVRICRSGAGSSTSAVQSELEQIHQRTPDREIAVKGDKLVKYGAVLDVLKALREVGFNNVGLIAQPKKTPSQGS